MLFLLPYSEGKPYFLGEAPAGKDAGSTVDYRFEFATAPNGARDVVSLIRQVAASLRGTAKVEFEFWADGRLHTTHTVYMQVAEPSSPSTGDYWLDTGQSPDKLKIRKSAAWKVVPDRARLDGVERDLELPVAARARMGSVTLRVTDLIGDFSVGSWALGAQALKKRV